MAGRRNLDLLEFLPITPWERIPSGETTINWSVKYGKVFEVAQSRAMREVDFFPANLPNVLDLW